LAGSDIRYLIDILCFYSSTRLEQGFSMS